MSDFYQSPSDKIRLEMMLTSLAEGGLNLAILGDDEVALSAYARRIYEHLKTLADAQVDLCLSADADKLVARFNQILSELTLDEALDKTQKAPVKRFLIFPDTQAVQDFELQLLARLINGLPASNIHVVLLLNRREPYEKKLQAFGKHLVQWILESEHPSSFSNGAALLAEEDNPFKSSKDELQSKGAMSSQAFKQQFVQRGFGPESAASSASEHHDRKEPNFEDTTSREPSLLEVELMAAIKAAEEKWQHEHHSPKDDLEPQSEESLPEPSSKSGKLGWGLLLGFLLSMSALAALYQEALLGELEHMKSYLTTPQWDQGKKATSPETNSESRGEIKKGDANDEAIKDSTPLAPTALASLGVGMSSSNKPPIVKADDSLIPEKEAILSPEKTQAKESNQVEPKQGLKERSKETPPGAVKEPLQESSKASAKESSKEAAKEVGKESNAAKAIEPAFKEPPLRIPVLKDPPALESKAALGQAKTEHSAPKGAAQAKTQSSPSLSPTSSEKVTPATWVSALPPKTWVLQLAAMPTRGEILSLQEDTPAFASAKVLLTQNPQSKKSYYILVRGPFASKDSAQNLMNSSPALAKAWLRSSQSLKAQFQAQGE